MASIKCCVVGCASTNKTHRLFFLPKDDKLRALWLSFLVPVNSKLLGLSVSQLLNKRVCQKHFERNQMDHMGNRLKYGYPCLFSAKEIEHGVPLSGDHHSSDHNYCLEEIKEISENPIDVQGDLTTLDSFQPSEAPSTSRCKKIEYIHLDTLESQGFIMLDSFQPSETPSTSRCGKTSDNIHLNALESQATVNQPATPKIHERKLKPKCTVQRILGKTPEKCKRFIKNTKKLALQNRTPPNNTFSEQYSNSKGLSTKIDFAQNINKLTPHAQNILRMQLKFAGKKKMAARFTTEEKMLSLSLMKESPKGYRFLQKIFRLPTERTLNRLSENISTGIQTNF